MMRLSPEAKRRGYWVYRHLIPRPFLRVRDVEIYSDGYDPALVDLFTALVTRGEPTFIGRIGGSDFDIATRYFDNPRIFENESTYNAAVARVQELNGYFDFAHDRETFLKYLDELVSDYKSADVLLYCNEGLITKFRHNVFQKRDMRLLNYICGGKKLIDYTFVESVSPFLESFKSWGEGKRILVVSPFSQSIEHQYQRLNELLVEYRFPSFELVTYNSPITYNTAEDTPQSLGVSTDNWHEQCQMMAEEIRDLDFDIAWLSCASYAMYLGTFIRDEMGRTSIYTGGILNVLFNIYGQRYDTPYFNSLVNPETQIEAFENDDVTNLKGGRMHANEALGAYFGKRVR